MDIIYIARSHIVYHIHNTIYRMDNSPTTRLTYHPVRIMPPAKSTRP